MTPIPLNEIYITYSYQDGIVAFFKILVIAIVLSLISMAIAYIIGIRKKDIVTVITTNIMVKTVVCIIWQIISNILDVGRIRSVWDRIYMKSGDIFVIAAYIISVFVVEGIIYNKILTYKKHKGMTVSIICNMGIMLSLIFIIIYFKII